MAFCFQPIVRYITSDAKCYTWTLRKSALIVKLRSLSWITMMFCDQASMRPTRNGLPGLNWCARPVLLQPFVQLRGACASHSQHEARVFRHSVPTRHGMWNSGTRTFAAKATEVDTKTQPALEQELSVNALSTQVSSNASGATKRCMSLARLCSQQFYFLVIPISAYRTYCAGRRG